MGFKVIIINCFLFQGWVTPSCTGDPDPIYPIYQSGGSAGDCGYYLLVIIPFHTFVFTAEGKCIWTNVQCLCIVARCERGLKPCRIIRPEMGGNMTRGVTMLLLLSQGIQRTMSPGPLTLRPQLPGHHLIGWKGKGRSRVGVFIFTLVGVGDSKHCFQWQWCWLASNGCYSLKLIAFTTTYIVITTAKFVLTYSKLGPNGQVW